MKVRLLAVILFLSSLFLFGCSDIQTAEPIAKSGMFFDTVINIQIFGSKDESILEHCMDMCREFENKFSRTIETSEIYQINHAKGMAVTVSSETAGLIKKGLYYSELSDGAFDITIAPLSELWDFQNNDGNIPPKEEIENARAHVDYRNVQVEGNTVILKDPNSAIDLGGIAKGYIADKLKEYLESEGIKHAIINLGGNVLTLGGKLNGGPFKIGIQKPFDETGAPITSVEATDLSVVSSGNYERYFKVDGKIYHHILNPKTGMPYDNHLYGVTILSKTSVDGDALSTVCYSLGLEKGMELIKSLDGVEALFITDDYKLHDSRTKE